MKDRSLYLDVASLFTVRSFRDALVWGWENRFTVGVLPMVFLLEAVILYAFNLSAAAMAGVGAVFCFISLFSMAYVWSIGSELADAGDKTLTHARVSRVDEHACYANAMAVFLLMGVVAVECAIRKEGGLWGPTWLMLVHFTFVLTAVLAFVVARFVLTGLTSERHKVWVRIFGASYTFTLVTGTSLILEKFPIS